MENLPDRPLIQDVYQILDSRVQYIDYQLRKLSKKTTDSHLLHAKIGNPIDQIEIIFKQIEQLNRSLKLLILLRGHLDILNAPLIFELLTDNKYLSLNETEIRSQLGVKSNQLSPGQRLLQSNR